jgi:hypothetical protein
VYVPNSGSSVTAGIYIRGDSTVTLSADAGNNQVVAIKVGGTTTTITVDRASNQTVVTDTTTTTYSGVPNGVIYSTGSITSLSGTVANNHEDGSQILARNAWTIATDVNSNKDITLTGNLKYQTVPDSTQSDNALCNLRAPILGLVARNVILSSSTPSDMTVDGIVLAGGENTTAGSFYNADYNGALKGYLHLLGGVIQKKRGPVGTFSQSTGQQVTGYNKDYNYDRRVVNHPPPCFPTTGQFDLKSWQYR